jgi:formylglycine-generating enzyme required for sulfatase activity
MIGNACEWCADWYDENYYSESPDRDPTGPNSGSSRVDRGGGWLTFAVFCRAANRDWGTPGRRFYYLGFRLARSSEE